MPNGYHDVSSYDHSAAVDDAFRRGVEKGKREAGRKTAYGVYRCVQARPSRTIRTPADLHRAEFTLLAPVQGTDDARPLDTTLGRVLNITIAELVGAVMLDD